MHHLLPGSTCSEENTYDHNHALQDFEEDSWRSCTQALKAFSDIGKSLVKIKPEWVGKSFCVKVFTGFKTWSLSLCRICPCCCSPCTHQCPSYSSLTGHLVSWPTHLADAQSIWDCQPLFKLQTLWLPATERWSGYGKNHILWSSLEIWPLCAVGFRAVLVLTRYEDRLFQ